MKTDRKFRPDFPKTERILKRRDFLALKQTGRRVHSNCFLAVFQKKTEITPRLGITVTRRVGNAVVRNRIKRLVRAFYRHQKTDFQYLDINIIAKNPSAGAGNDAVRTDLTVLLKKVKRATANHPERQNLADTAQAL